MLQAHYSRVSLFIPCFHSPAYVGDAIPAAVAQRYDHIEIIVGPNDCQTYVHLRDTFKSPQIRILPPGLAPGPSAGATLETTDVI
jgi:hypothetical protein